MSLTEALHKPAHKDAGQSHLWSCDCPTLRGDSYSGSQSKKAPLQKTNRNFVPVWKCECSVAYESSASENDRGNPTSTLATVSFVVNQLNNMKSLNFTSLVLVRVHLSLKLRGKALPTRDKLRPPSSLFMRSSGQDAEFSNMIISTLEFFFAMSSAGVPQARMKSLMTHSVLRHGLPAAAAPSGCANDNHLDCCKGFNVLESILITAELVD